MANHLQAKKRIRQTIKRTSNNRYFKSTVRTYVKALRIAIDAGEKETAKSTLVLAIKSLDKAVTKGIMKRTTASRTISRLTLAVNKIS